MNTFVDLDIVGLHLNSAVDAYPAVAGSWRVTT